MAAEDSLSAHCLSVCCCWHSSLFCIYKRNLKIDESLPHPPSLYLPLSQTGSCSVIHSKHSFPVSHVLIWIWLHVPLFSPPPSSSSPSFSSSQWLHMDYSTFTSMLWFSPLITSLEYYFSKLLCDPMLAIVSDHVTKLPIITFQFVNSLHADRLLQ